MTERFVPEKEHKETDNETLLQGIRNGVTVQMALKDREVPSTNLLRKIAKIRPLETLRYMKKNCPEKIDTNMARHLAFCLFGENRFERTVLGTAKNWLHNISEKEFSDSEIYDELLRNVRETFETTFKKLDRFRRSVEYSYIERPAVLKKSSEINEEKFLQRIRNGVDINFALREYEAPSTDLLKKMVEIRPLDTVKYMNRYCPEKIDINMAEYIASCVLKRKTNPQAPLEKYHDFLCNISPSQFSKREICQRLPYEASEAYLAKINGYHSFEAYLKEYYGFSKKEWDAFLVKWEVNPTPETVWKSHLEEKINLSAGKEDNNTLKTVLTKTNSCTLHGKCIKDSIQEKRQKTVKNEKVSVKSEEQNTQTNDMRLFKRSAPQNMETEMEQSVSFIQNH